MMRPLIFADLVEPWLVELYGPEKAERISWFMQDHKYFSPAELEELAKLVTELYKTQSFKAPDVSNAKVGQLKRMFKKAMAEMSIQYDKITDKANQNRKEAAEAEMGNTIESRLLFKADVVYPEDFDANEATLGAKYWVSPTGEFKQFKGGYHIDGLWQVAPELFKDFAKRNKVTPKKLKADGELLNDLMDEMVFGGWARVWKTGDTLYIGLEDEGGGEKTLRSAVSAIPELNFVDEVVIGNTSVSVDEGEDAETAWRHRNSPRKRVQALLASGEKHEWGCVMLSFPKDFANKVKAWGESNIPEDALYLDPEDPTSHGRETQIHTTCVYGLDPKVTPEEIKQVLSDHGEIKVKLGKLSKFEKEGLYDVLKFDVESSELHAAHQLLKDTLGVPGETFPDFKPHLTLAYTLPKACDDLLGEAPFEGQEFILSDFDYSRPETPGAKDTHTEFRVGKVEAKLNPRGVIHAIAQRPVIFADALTDLYKEAAKFVQEDPKWENYTSDPQKAAELGAIQKALSESRSESEIEKAWATYAPSITFEELKSRVLSS